MILRTYALYGRNRKILIFLSFMLCTGVGMGMVSVMSTPPTASIIT